MSACLLYPTFVALWAGELEESEAAAIDEHLFGCDPCAAATERLAKVVGTLREKAPLRVVCQRHYEGMFPAGDPILSVHAVEAGKRRVVGEYVVTHVWR